MLPESSKSIARAQHLQPADSAALHHKAPVSCYQCNVSYPQAANGGIAVQLQAIRLLPSVVLLHALLIVIIVWTREAECRTKTD